jgi:hypothetical protein
VIGMIEAADLTGIDEDLALHVLAVARPIAPCLSNLAADSPERATAIAILKRVAKDVGARGSRHIKSQRIGPAGVDYDTTAAWFSPQDADALRALCTVADASNRAPVGHFPVPGLTARLWPETY